MKKKLPVVPERYWRGGRVKLGVEYYHNPSIRAQNCFFYPISIGRSRAPRGHEHEHQPEDRFLLHYIQRGIFWHRTGSVVHRVGDGGVCLLDLRAPVSYGTGPVRFASVWWVCFGGKGMPHLAAELGIEHEPVFNGIDRDRFESRFLELLRSFQNKSNGFEAHASGWIALLLAELFAVRDAQGEPDLDLVRLPVGKDRLSLPVRDSIRYIARFYDTPLNLKQLHSVSGLSMHHFSRSFRRETGMSPMHYLNRYRIEKARRILAGSQHPIHQIGSMVGMTNPFKFSRQFHKVAGMTPSRFRARAQSRTTDSR